VPDIPAAKAWYEKAFGATPGQRQRMAGPGTVECSYISPRITISFNPTRAGGTPLAATKGRVNDHFGFDVRNLDAFIKRLQDAGITPDAAPIVLPGTNVRSIFVTDPVGARIEVTENFASLALP
jgi:catechol 2,3-dioxygenase-like lactoylglutathione lyase family enzyme